jgi:hypothetical protein
VRQRSESQLVNPADSVVAAKVPEPILARLHAVAREHDRTLSGQIRRVLRAWYDEQQRATPAPPAVERGAR